MHGRIRARLAAVLLGLTMACLVSGGFVYGHLSYVSGRETCVRCGMHRELDRRGPFWFRSAPYVSRYTARPDPLPPVCDPHQWRATGCWIDRHGCAYLAPVRFD